LLGIHLLDQSTNLFDCQTDSTDLVINVVVHNLKLVFESLYLLIHLANPVVKTLGQVTDLLDDLGLDFVVFRLDKDLEGLNKSTPLSKKRRRRAVGSKNEDLHALDKSDGLKKDTGFHIHLAFEGVPEDHVLSHSLLVALCDLGNKEVESKDVNEELIQQPEEPNARNHEVCRGLVLIHSCCPELLVWLLEVTNRVPVGIKSKHDKVALPGSCTFIAVAQTVWSESKKSEDETGKDEPDVH